jgi:hypothetical protein
VTRHPQTGRGNGHQQSCAGHNDQPVTPPHGTQSRETHGSDYQVSGFRNQESRLDLAVRTYRLARQLPRSEDSVLAHMAPAVSWKANWKSVGVSPLFRTMLRIS